MNYLLRHAQVLLATLGQMTRAPLATLLTLTVIGITLALPSGLYVMLDNLERLSAGWDRGAQASLFLKRNVTEAGAHKLAQQIRAMSSVAGVDYISREAAFAEFKKQSGFGTALNALDSNPLPAVLVVRLSVGDNPAAVESLMATLARLPGVDLAQLDIEWLRRLAALLQLAERAVAMLAALLSLAVLLIIGNTIRLAVVSRRDRDRDHPARGRDAGLRAPALPIYRPAPGAARWVAGLAAGGSQPVAAQWSGPGTGRTVWQQLRPDRPGGRAGVIAGHGGRSAGLGRLAAGGRLATAPDCIALDAR